MTQQNEGEANRHANLYLRNDVDEQGNLYLRDDCGQICTAQSLRPSDMYLRDDPSVPSTDKTRKAGFSKFANHSKQVFGTDQSANSSADVISYINPTNINLPLNLYKRCLSADVVEDVAVGHVSTANWNHEYGKATTYQKPDLISSQGSADQDSNSSVQNLSAPATDQFIQQIRSGADQITDRENRSGTDQELVSVGRTSLKYNPAFPAPPLGDEAPAADPAGDGGEPAAPASVGRISRIAAQIFRARGAHKRTVKLYVWQSFKPQAACDHGQAVEVFFNTASPTEFRKAVKRNRSNMPIGTYQRLMQHADDVAKVNRDRQLNTEREMCTLGYLSMKPAGQGTINDYESLAVLDWHYSTEERAYIPGLAMVIDGETILIDDLIATGNKNAKASEFVGYYDPEKLWQRFQNEKKQASNQD